MAYNYEYPYTDAHRYNDDWLINKVKELAMDWLKTSGEWTETQGAWEELKRYITDYFNNLDVQDEINEKLEAMKADGTLFNIIRPLFDDYQRAIDVLSARMDAFTALGDDATTGDAELADIRVDYTGHTWPNAGDAVRGVTGQLSSDLVNFYKGMCPMKLELSKEGYIDYINGGVVQTSPDMSHTDFIKVYQGQKVHYKLQGVPGSAVLAFYTIKHESGYQYGLDGIWHKQEGIYEVPQDGYIMCCSLRDLTDGYLYTILESDYIKEEIIKKSSSNIKDLSNTFVLNFGDSCSHGIGAWDETIQSYWSYSRLFCEEHNATLLDYSVSGCPLSNLSDNSVCDQVDQAITEHANDNISVILVEGGINDLKWGNSVGSITYNYSGSGLDDTTIVGAMETIFYKLRTTFPKSIIIWVTYHHMPVGTLAQQNTQYEGVVSACQKWGVAIADVFKEGQLNSNIESMANAYFVENAEEMFGRDIAHPNKEAYEKFYLPLIDRIVN